MENKIIFIGSTHGFIEDYIKQKEIISSVHPDFVLCENLEDYILDSNEKFGDLIKERKISNMTSFEEVEKLIKLCYEKKIKLIGIDFPNFGFNENLQKKIKSQEELNSDEEKEIEDILKKRTENHIKKIEEFLKKTKKPLAVILGSWHLRENSQIRNRLNNYKIIAPCDNDGNLLITPPKEDKINYGEIYSDGKPSKD